jgi:hypothetical protein
VTAPIRIRSFRAVRRNLLHGFATVEMPSGLIITDIVIGSSHGKWWALPPSEPMIDGNGNPLRDEETGKVRYSPVVDFRDKETRRRWSDAVIAALRASHEEVFEEAFAT